MSRDDAYLKILSATADIQQYVAGILQAKAAEARKTRNWLCHHVHRSSFEDQHGDQFEESYKFHEQIVEAIDGITKVEEGLAANLKVLLGQEEESAGGMNSLSDLLALNDGDDK